MKLLPLHLVKVLAVWDTSQLITQEKTMFCQNTKAQNKKGSGAGTKSGTGSWRELKKERARPEQPRHGRAKSIHFWVRQATQTLGANSLGEHPPYLTLKDYIK